MEKRRGKRTAALLNRDYVPLDGSALSRRERSSGEAYRRIGTVSLRLLLLEDRDICHTERLVPRFHSQMKSLHRMRYHVRPGCRERVGNADAMRLRLRDRERVDWWIETGVQYMHYSLNSGPPPRCCVGGASIRRNLSGTCS